MSPRFRLFVLVAIGTLIAPGAQAAPSPAPAEDSFDYARLAHPDVANRLQLTDPQRATVTSLLNERAEALSKAEAKQRSQIIADSNKKLADVLTDAQRTQLQELPSQQKLTFNFRQQKWEDVLDWFAKQAGLSLVIDKPPPGNFNYSDTKSYSPAQAIDLLNSVLMTKGYALLRRERMLLCIDLSSGIPDGLIPRVKLEDLDQFGQHEFVSVMFPLGRKPAQTVLDEIQPLLGTYGDAAALPQTKQLLVTETAGKMKAISILISSIPEPEEKKEPKPKPPEPPKPKPELVVYPAKSIDVKAATEVLKTLIKGATFTSDAKAEQISAYATPDQQKAVKTALDQMMANNPPDKQPRLEVYPLTKDHPKELEEQLKAVAPDIQFAVDDQENRLLVFATPEEHQFIETALSKLDATTAVAGGQQVVVYRLRRASAEAVASVLETIAPRALIVADSAAQRVIARATPEEQLAIRALVQQIDPQTGASDAPSLQIYTVPQPPPKDLVATLQAVAPRATITAQADGQRLSIVATQDDHDLIRKTLNELETAEEGTEKGQLGIYPVTPTQRKRFNALVGSLSGDLPGMRVVDGSSADELMIWATRSQHEILQALIESLKIEMPESERSQLTAYTLEQGDPSSVEAMLRQMYPDTKIVLDTPTGRLLVWARPEAHAKIQQVIEQLDVPSTPPNAPVLHVYDVPRLPGNELVDSLRAVAPQAKLNPQADGRRLSVVASPSDHELIEKAIAQLKTVDTSDDKRRLQVYPVTPEQRQRFDAVIGSMQDELPGITVIRDAPPNELMIWARPTQHQMLQELIDSLKSDVPESERNQLITHTFESGDPNSAQTMLREMFPGVKIVLDSRSNGLMVWAQPEVQAEIRKVIQQLDLPSTRPDAPVLHVYDVPRLPGNELLDSLRAIAPQAKLNPQADGRRLSVVASPRDQIQIEKAISQLKTVDTSDDKRTLKVYPVTPDQRKRFDAVIDSMQDELPGIKIIRDARPGELAIWARASQHQVLGELLESLRRDVPEEEQLQVAAYPLATSDPTMVSDMLKDLYPDAKIMVDEASSRIMVWTTPAQQAQIKQAVERLDSTQRPAGTTKTLMSYPLGDYDPTQMITMLQTLVPRMQLVPDRRAHAVVAWGTLSDHQVLSRTLEQFRRGDPAEQRTLIVYPTGPRDPHELRDLIRDMAPDANVVADDAGRNVAAWATAEEHLAIAAAIRQITGGGESDHSLVVYNVEQTGARQARNVLEAIVPGAQLTVGADSDQLLAWATASQHERLRSAIQQMEAQDPASRGLVLQVHNVEDGLRDTAMPVLRDALPNLKMVSGSDPDKLIVWARPQDHATIESILKTLKTEAATKQNRTIAVYTLTKVDQDTARRILQDSLPQLEYLDSGDPRRLMILATVERHETIKKILDELERTAPEPQTTVLRMYPLGEVDPEMVTRALDRELLEGVTVIPDRRERRLFIRTTVERHDRIKAALEAILPELPAVEEAVSRVYRFNASDPQTALAVLQALIPAATYAVNAADRSLVVSALPSDHERIRQTVDQLEQNNGLVLQIHEIGDEIRDTAMPVLQEALPHVRMVPGPDRDKLIVWARAEDHATIQTILKTVQEEAGTERNRTIAVYDLKNLDQSTARRVLQESVPQLEYLESRDPRKLVILATAPRHESVGRILEGLEASAPERESTVLRVYSLGEVDPATATRALDGELLEGVTVIPDPRQKRLFVRTTAERHERIKAALDEVVPELPPAEEAVSRVYRFQTSDPEAARRVLTSLVPTATYAVDTVNRSLVVSALPADHDRIKQTVDQLEEGGAEKAETRVYQFHKGDPQAAMTVLQRLMPSAALAVDSSSRTLAATALPAEHETIKTTVEQMDRGGQEGYETRVYRLRGGSSYSARTALQSLLPGATIAADYTNNVLIATAAPEDHTTIEAVVKKMDRAEEEGYETRVYRLPEGNPYYARLALQQLLPDATIAADPASRTLIATAAAEDHKQIEAVVEKMSRSEEGYETRVYRLKQGNPSYAAQALSQLLPDATIAADQANRQLIATADLEDHKQIEAVVKKMDGATEGLETRVYRLPEGNPTYARLALQQLLPDATIAADPYSRTLIATAAAEDHVKIEEVVKKMSRGDEEGYETRVYQLRRGNPAYARMALESLLPDATLAADSVNGTLIATASPEDHQKIDAVVKKIDRTDKEGYVTQVYRLRDANASSAQSALETLLPDATIVADSRNDLLFVTAGPEDHKQVEAIVKKMTGAEGYETRVYRFKEANAYYARSALQALLPDAEISADYRSNLLIATATTEDHEKIQSVVQEMDKADNNKVARAYAMQKADGDAVYDVLRDMYRRDPDVSVSYDETSNAIMVVADARTHAIIDDLVQQMEKSAQGDSGAKLQVYSLANVDGAAVLPALEGLFENERPAVEFTMEPYSNSLMAVALPQQHEMIATALSQLRVQERQVEVFQLEVTDPMTVKLAVDNLFVDDPSMPLLDADPSTQRLIVRANKEQMTRIRELLTKMGEPNLDASAGGQTMRTITFSGDATSAIDQIQRLWPKLRRNEIRVVTPSQVERRPTAIAPSPSPEPPAESGETTEVASGAVPVEPSRQEAPVAEDTSRAEDRPEVGAPNPASPSDAVQEKTDTNSATNPQEPAEEAAPVVVIPGQGKITIASSDPEALKQFETLLRAILRRDNLGASGNFTVYTLRNAAAVDVANLLSELSRRLPYTSQGSLGRVAVVADARLNALIVHGGRADQAVVENLLEILDASNIPDSVATMRPQIVPLHNTEADRILRILQTVYKTQLTAGSSRSQISVPQGVPPQVATLLRQINAAVSGPILTLEIDEVTNAIIIFAPMQLGEEVAQLIRQLDDNALENPARSVEIISLEQMNTTRLRDALDILVRQPSGRRRSRR